MAQLAALEEAPSENAERQSKSEIGSLLPRVSDDSLLTTVPHGIEVLPTTKEASSQGSPESVEPMAERGDVPPPKGDRIVRIRRAMDDTRLVNIQELSQHLNIPRGTLYNWVYLRRIPFIKAGRSLRFDVREVIQSLRHCPILDLAGQR